MSVQAYAKGQRAFRRVYPARAMLELTQNQMERFPTGPLFGNSRGKPWTRNAMRCCFRNHLAKLAHLKGVASYTYRHSFATDGLVGGVGIAQVAELLGHTSTDMVMQHDQHLREQHDHLTRAASQASRQVGQQGIPAPKVE